MEESNLVQNFLNYSDQLSIFSDPTITPTTNISGYSPDETNVLRITARVLCGFSITGLLFVQIVFWFFRSIRTFALELVALLCFSNIMFNISVYLPIYSEDNIENFNGGNISASCSAQAFVNTLGDLSSMLWTTIIGYTAYISVANQEHLEKNKMKYRIAFILIAYVMPLGFSLIVLLTHSYGPAGIFCWIATNVSSTRANVLTIAYYSLTWGIIIVNCVFVFKVIFILKRELQNESVLVDKYISKLRLYPIVQIISFIPCTVNRIYNLSTGKENFTLMLIQIIFDSLTGLMFALVYGFNASVKKALSDCWDNICCNKFKKRGSTFSQSAIETTSSNINPSKTLSFIEDTVITE